jgi:hypothetical protein
MTDAVAGAKLWFIAREGAQLAYWMPQGLLEAVIEVHPDHPPIMHWVDGTHEEMKLDPQGRAYVVVDRVDPNARFSVSVGPADYENAPAPDAKAQELIDLIIEGKNVS